MRQDFGGILKITSDNQLITGGSFGPEAGLLGLVVVILAFVVVFWWMQSRQTSVFMNSGMRTSVKNIPAAAAHAQQK
ncbi:MAG: hypothetical protein WCE94_07400 [Candidatus Methanoperedens sp.]